jgi:FYN binding protein
VFSLPGQGINIGKAKTEEKDPKKLKKQEKEEKELRKKFKVCHI